MLGYYQVLNYFLIPGNPPAAHFYQKWGEEIIGLKPEARFIVSHYPDLKRVQDAAVAMKEVADHHLKELLAFKQQVAGPIIILGHSLGGHFALRLVELAPDSVERAVLLHPFLRGPSFRAKLLLKALGSIYEQEKVHRGLVRSRKALELMNSDLPHVTDQEILRSLHLARHESLTIAQDDSPIQIPPNLREKIVVFHTQKDDWCTIEVVAQLRAQVRVHECVEPHGFVTQQKHRRRLFDQVCGAIY